MAEEKEFNEGDLVKLVRVRRGWQSIERNGPGKIKFGTACKWVVPIGTAGVITEKITLMGTTFYRVLVENQMAWFGSSAIDYL